jgi:hypothetical protein
MPPEPEDWHMMEPPAGWEPNSGWDEFGLDLPQKPAPRGASKSPALKVPDPQAAGLKAAVQEPAAAQVVKAAPDSGTEPPSGTPETEAGGLSGVGPARPFVPVAYFVPPASLIGMADLEKKDAQPRMLTVVLRPTGNKERDVRRLRNVHGLLVSSPGKDRFSFMLFERNSYFLIEFPNETIGINPELVHRLVSLVGEDNIKIEPIKIQ